MSDTVTEWIAAGNRVTRCPTAFVAETRQARALAPEQIAALRDKPVKPETKAGWNSMGGLTQRKAPIVPVAPDAAAVADGMPATAVSRPMPYLGASEVTVRVFDSGLREVHTRDHQGRWFISRFGPARNGLSNYQGTQWVNKAAFRGADPT